MYICELNIRINSMISSRKNFLFEIFNDKRTVYRLNDIAMLLGETNFVQLNKRINYYVKTGKLLNPRKGIYTKPDFSSEELACRVFVPSYISTEYVLQRAGVIFQYSNQITSVSYLSRSIEINNQNFSYRKIKSEILVDNRGINQKSDFVNIATPERAFLDVLYLNKDYYFDRPDILNRELVMSILPIYNSQLINQKVNKILGK